MKKIFLILLVSMFYATRISAQNNNGLTVGLTGSVTTDLLKGDKSDSYLAGAELFANYQYYFYRNFFVQPEVGISGMWNDLETNKSFTEGCGPHESSPKTLVGIKTNMWILSLRARLGLKFLQMSTWNMAFVTGPEFNWLFDKNVTRSVKSGENLYTDGLPWPFNNWINGWNFGLQCQWKKFVFTASYTLKFGKMRPDVIGHTWAEKGGEPDLIRIGVGYKF